MERAFFISDVHLGALYAQADPRRAAYLEDFLRSLPEKAARLFILGDLFEFWMEHRHYIPKGHFGVLTALRDLGRSGVPVHYLCGNHDFTLGNFFREELGVETHDGPLAIELQGKRLLLLHGDGMGSGDLAYKAVKKIARSRWAGVLYRLLHPDLGMDIALRASKLSRDRHGNVPRHLDRYEAAARALLHQGHDIVMHGHVHAGFVKKLPEGVYVNTGEWFERLQYVEMVDGECFLRAYDPLTPRPPLHA